MSTNWFSGKWLLVVSTSMLLSCLHARQTKSQEEAKGAPSAKNSKEQPAKAKPKAPVRSETIDTSKTTKQMFKPEGLKKLQVALSAKSVNVDETGQLDSATQEALRAYQNKKGLPATGLPDYETLRRLGLQPDEVYHRDPPAERVGLP